jgi:DNA-binding FrmR family transcriptional regulator|tara:strand:- start:2 stop:262 length:261 start_codon:yes stop_codon:yes gene_type:complete
MVKKQSPRKTKLAESERALRDIKKKVSAWKAQLAELDRISGALNKNLGRLMRIRGNDANPTIDRKIKEVVKQINAASKQYEKVGRN